MWGIIPAAGNGTRIQPLAFSKELLPVGSRHDESGAERPRAVSEYLVDRMMRGGATRICFVISPWKSDILRYYGGSIGGASLAYVIQDEAAGCVTRSSAPLPLIRADEQVIVGLPDTIWFPEDALRALPDDRFSFLLFPVDQPELFDAVETDPEGRVRQIAGESPRCALALDLGCVQAARCGSARAARALDGAGESRTSISAHWSMPIWKRAERRGAHAQARATSMSERSTATARQPGCWKRGRTARSSPPRH